ncbi:alpha/beta hydrolase [Singulisphaera sp. Ch08]|uniref:Alpha/beta hydrolase n=1 Tax=Singulisphaera sp. Ch08 TaxID=3120278 RepID=A0AAU7CQU3_9BACT
MMVESVSMKTTEEESPSASRGPERPVHPPGLIRRIRRLFCLPFTIYIGVGVMLFALQVDLIFPGAKRQGDPSTLVKARPDEQIVTLTTTHDDRVVALFAPALTPEGKPHPNAPACPSLLYFYGNAMCLSDAIDQVEHFRRLGVNVLTPDYVGYGMSGGKASESGCQATADAALAHLKSRKDVDPTRIIAAGWSLGGAVAIDLASRGKVQGVISFCTFTSMAEMARRNIPLLPASLLLRHRFDNESKIAKVTCPILIGHGRRDTLIPHSMADRLATAARAPVMRFTVEEAGHNDFFATGGDQVLDSMRTFIAPFARTE